MVQSSSKADIQPVFILLPSAVEPPSSMPFLALRDKSARYEQTIKALKFWSSFQTLEGFEVKVVIGDNTGWSDRLYKGAQKHYAEGSLFSVDVPAPNDDVIQRGKGAAETDSLLWMLRQIDIPDSALVIKMTARQYCVNAADLLVHMPSESNFAAWPRPFLDSIDSRFYIGRAGYLRKVLPVVSKETDDLKGIFVEHLYAQLCIWDNRGGYVRLEHEPGILGQAGTTGTQLSRLSESVLIAYLVNFRRFLRLRLTWIQPKYARKGRK